MSIGVYYYAEAWPESQWERDLSSIKKLGFAYIQLAEFVRERNVGASNLSLAPFVANQSTSGRAGIPLQVCGHSGGADDAPCKSMSRRS